MLKTKDSWDKLSMFEKADLIKYAVQNGIYNPNTVRQAYNEFAEGGEKDGEMTRVRRANGEYAFVKTKDGHAITDGTGRYPLYNSSGTVIGTGVGDSFPYVGDVRDEGYLDEIIVTPQGMQTQDTTYSADALLKAAQQAERNKEITRNRAIDAKVSQYDFTPEGFFGQALQPMNLLSPTHTGRGIYNLASGNGYGDMRDLFLPNSGVFSDEFAADHPYLTMAGNVLTDALTLGAGSALWKMPKYRAALQAENRAAQEAVANQWDNVISRGTSTRAPSASTANPGSMVLLERPTSSLSARERLGLPKGSKVYTDAENRQFLNQINDFAGKYEYPGLEEGTYSAQELESYARALIDRHNSFYRGVRMPEGDDLAAVKSILGKNATDDDILRYVATHGKQDTNGRWLFTSPKTNAGMYGQTARITRPYSLGADRTKWFTEGDYSLVAKDPNTSWYDFRNYKGMLDPWAKPVEDMWGNITYSTEIPNEVVSVNQPMVFRDWAEELLPQSNKTVDATFSHEVPNTLFNKIPQNEIEGYFGGIEPVDDTLKRVASQNTKSAVPLEEFINNPSLGASPEYRKAILEGAENASDFLWSDAYRDRMKTAIERLAKDPDNKDLFKDYTSFGEISPSTAIARAERLKMHNNLNSVNIPLDYYPAGYLEDKSGVFEDAAGLYNKVDHRIGVDERTTQILNNNTPEHEFNHATRGMHKNRDIIRANNKKYQMASNDSYYRDLEEQRVRVLSALREMQSEGININSLSDETIENFLGRPIETLSSNTVDLITHYNMDDIKKALRNFIVYGAPTAITFEALSDAK